MSRILWVLFFLIIAGALGFTVWLARSSVMPAAGATPYTAELESRLSEFRRIQNLTPNLIVFQDRLFQALRSPVSGVATSTFSRGRVNPFLPF